MLSSVSSSNHILPYFILSCHVISCPIPHYSVSTLKHSHTSYSSTFISFHFLSFPPLVTRRQHIKEGLVMVEEENGAHFNLRTPRTVVQILYGYPVLHCTNCTALTLLSTPLFSPHDINNQSCICSSAHHCSSFQLFMKPFTCPAFLLFLSSAPLPLCLHSLTHPPVCVLLCVYLCYS
jgi:hypothetical protein